MRRHPLPSIETLVEGLLRGDKLALARLITIVERESPDAPEILKLASPHAGKGYRIGFTGPPGSGKSTIVDALIGVIRGERSEDAPQVGIIAVDPSSPFSGGALLGDRVRMERHYKDPGVYIRSMGSRGSHGGMSSVSQRVAVLMEAAGKDYVLIETVGVGQTELDIMEAADTVVVVLVPEAGDTIQTMKAGLMEIGDIFLVNKADREGAERLEKDISQSLHLSYGRSFWEPPVLKTHATKGLGVPDLFEKIGEHRHAAEEAGELQRRRERRQRAQFLRTVEEKISGTLHDLLAQNGDLRAVLERVHNGQIDPYSAAMEVLGDRDLLHKWLSSLER